MSTTHVGIRRRLTRGLKVFVGGGPGFQHPQQGVLHNLDVGEGTVALGILVGTLADAPVVVADVLPFSIAHDIAQRRLHKLLLQVVGKDDLEAWQGEKKKSVD